MMKSDEIFRSRSANAKVRMEEYEPCNIQW